MSNEPLKKQNVSPRAPYLDLQQSLNIISMLKNVGLQNATFNKEQFFKAIGSSSGAAVRKLAGLGYYGLLTKSGKGEYKISKEAVIGGDINEERKFELLQEFSLNPGVFKSLYEQFGSDSAMETLSSYLQVKHTPPFNQETADRVAKNFIANCQFAKIEEGLPDEPANFGEEVETSSAELSDNSVDEKITQIRVKEGWNILIDRSFSYRVPDERFIVSYTGELDDRRLQIIVKALNDMLEGVSDEGEPVKRISFIEGNNK